MKKTLGIVGTGKIGSIVANAWKDGFLKEYDLIYIAGRDAEKAQKLAKETGAAAGGTVTGLYEAKPDYVVEAASIAFLKEHAEKIVENGSNLVVISIGAFADKEFYQKISDQASKQHVHVYISNGVVGGFDVLRTFRLLGDVDAHFTTRKGPLSLQGTPLYKVELLENEKMVFDGTAADIIKILPTKVNVAVASSLAAADPESTKTSMISVPGMIGDQHTMVAKVDGNEAEVRVYTTNGSLAAWGIVATLQNILSPIVFA